jgi:hypothetical protein
MDEDIDYGDEDDLTGDSEEAVARPLTETELAEAEERNLVRRKVEIEAIRGFPWASCPVWQEDIPPEDRDPPWRIPGQRASGYFRIDEIERFLLLGDHPLNESNE